VRSQQPFSRAERVADMIQREVGEMLLRGEVKDPRIGFVTVTHVALSADLRCAKVYVSVLGSEQAKHETLVGLNSAVGFIQRELGRRIKLRYTPEVRILHDESFEQAARINALLKGAGGGGEEA